VVAGEGLGGGDIAGEDEQGGGGRAELPCGDALGDDEIGQKKGTLNIGLPVVKQVIDILESFRSVK